MSQIEQNKAVVKDFIDAVFTRGELGAVEDFLTEDFHNHHPAFGTSDDRQGMRDGGTLIRAGFPDWHSDMEMFIGEGDLVTEVFTAAGTHRGEVAGIPPTGKTVAIRGINVWRLRDGRIVERWGLLDELGMLSQLGVMERP